MILPCPPAQTGPGCEFRHLLGRQLLAAREHRGLRLLDVQDMTSGRWTASTLGACERGIRSLTVARLVDLADVYDVPVTQLIPGGNGDRETASQPLVLDVSKLGDPTSTRTGLVRRWVDTVISSRADPTGGDVIRLRGGDLHRLAAAYRMQPETFRQRLAVWGVVAGGGQ